MAFHCPSQYRFLAPTRAHVDPAELHTGLTARPSDLRPFRDYCDASVLLWPRVLFWQCSAAGDDLVLAEPADRGGRHKIAQGGRSAEGLPTTNEAGMFMKAQEIQKSCR